MLSKLHGRLFLALLVGLSLRAAAIYAGSPTTGFTGLRDAASLFWTNRDFSNYWIAAVLALKGQAMDLFSGHEVYFAHMQAVFGADYPWHSWSYPPHFLLLIWPLGLMDHIVALPVFLALTLLLFLHAVHLAAKDMPAVGWLLLAPFILCNILSAQNGFLTGALMLYGLGLRERRPIVAGIAIGMLTIKPQLGILLPLLLIFERRWQVIASAAVTTVAMVGLSLLVWGGEVWRGYLNHTVPYQAAVMTDGTGDFLHMMLSVFGSLRSLGFDSSEAMVAHLPVAAVAFALFVASLFVFKEMQARAFSMVLATFLISPYSLSYDLGAASFFAALWAGSAARDGAAVRLPRPFAGLVYVAIAFLPLAGLSSSLLFSLPIAPIVLALAWAVLFTSELAAHRSGLRGPVTA